MAFVLVVAAVPWARMLISTVRTMLTATPGGAGGKVEGGGGAAQPTRVHAAPRQMLHGLMVDLPAGLR